MTTQSKMSRPVEVAHERKLSGLLAISMLAVGIALGVLASHLPTILSQIGISGAPVGEVRNVVPQLENEAVVAGETQTDRARQAEAARYTSLGQYYAAGNEANVQRAVAAESARYKGLAGFYGIERRSERAIAAEAARYTGLASYYTGDMANVERAMAADSARYQGLAGFYGAVTEPSVAGLVTTSDAQLHAIEKLFVSFDENALAAYHQSEWGGVPQAIGTEAGRDIGLAVRPEETEVLSTIDPADRKFFTPGYGTQYINGDKNQLALPTTVNEPGNQIPIWFLLK